jgi:hypothetical protein
MLLIYRIYELASVQTSSGQGTANNACPLKIGISDRIPLFSWRAPSIMSQRLILTHYCRLQEPMIDMATAKMTICATKKAQLGMSMRRARSVECLTPEREAVLEC